MKELRNLGGMQSSAIHLAMKLPMMVGASGVSRMRSDNCLIRKSKALPMSLWLITYNRKEL